MRSVRIVILAKAPLPGLAKTRLIPALGEQGAADLAARMLERTIAHAVTADVGPVELCASPSSSAPIWQQLAIPASVSLTEQIDGDLGDRMAHINHRVIDGGESVIMIGTDCPQLTAAMLANAARALDHHDGCIAPVTDGGYALLGLNRYLPVLFANMPWSTARVASITAQRMHDAGYTMAKLPTLHDIDTPDDLQWLPESWQPDFCITTQGVNHD